MDDKIKKAATIEKEKPENMPESSEEKLRTNNATTKTLGTGTTQTLDTDTTQTLDTGTTGETNK